MKEIINNILSEKKELIAQRNASIKFEIDYEGKGLLNKEISKFYDKHLKLTDQDFKNIVVTSHVIIEKMAKLQKCGWRISELNEQLSSGIYNYQKQMGLVQGNHKSKSYADKAKLLNATAIGNIFHISSQRLNLLLNELGWIEKSIAGWSITELGRNFGGKQFEHETSGGTYVLWPDSILKNKDILELFEVKPLNIPLKTEDSSVDLKIDLKNEVPNDFRKTYPAEYRTKDGHYVRSKAEMAIDDSLYLWGIPHAYEKKIPNTDENVYSDFHIPSFNPKQKAVYIEYWGIENDVKYNERKSRKITIYESLGLSLIQLNDGDIKNIEDTLQKYLRQHGISVN